MRFRLSYLVILSVTGGCAGELATKLYHSFVDGRLIRLLGSL